MTPPRILVVDHAVERGGAQLAIARLVEALGRSIEATFVLPERGPFYNRLTAAGHRVELVPLGPVRTVRISGIHPLRDTAMHGPGLLAAATRIAGLARELQVHAIYTNTLKAHVYGSVAARLARLPNVVHVRDILAPPYLPQRLRHALWLFFALFPPTAVVVNSNATARAAPTRRPTLIVFSGITRRPRAAATPRAGRLTLALLGRIERWKGQDVAIRALPRILARHPDAQLVIGGGLEAGEPQYAEELHDLARCLGVEQSVEFAGFVEDPYGFFERAHIALHTSVLPEPMGQVIVEALSVGRPVIATAAGGPVEILSEGRGGILAPPGDPRALADFVLRLVDDRELYGQLSAAGLKRAGAFTIDASAQQILTLLEALRDDGMAALPSSGEGADGQ